MYDLNEKVVYPGHGVAQIVRIIEKQVAGSTTNFYELKFINKEATVLVPTHGAEVVGIRPLNSPQGIDEALIVLGYPARRIANSEFSASNWNKRNKEYQLKLRRSNLRELAEVYRDLRYIETQKELSFGEKNILNQTESLIAEEISAASCVAPDMAVEQLRILCIARRCALEGCSQSK
jgi:CarD family transcriptional regulator